MVNPIAGDAVPLIDLRVVQGDTFSVSMRRSNDDGIIDTADYDARAMIRSKKAVTVDGVKTYPLICELVTTETAGKGLITLGIVGNAPVGDDPDLRTNVTLLIPADVTAAFPRVSDETKAAWSWDLEMISDPLDAPNSTDKWGSGSVFLTNEWTFDEVDP